MGVKEEGKEGKEGKGKGVKGKGKERKTREDSLYDMKVNIKSKSNCHWLTTLNPNRLPLSMRVLLVSLRSVLTY